MSLAHEFPWKGTYEVACHWRCLLTGRGWTGLSSLSSQVGEYPSDTSGKAWTSEVSEVKGELTRKGGNVPENLRRHEIFCEEVRGH